MIKSITAAASAAAAAIILAAAPSMTASATTVYDVAEVARQYGYSEELIMQGFNEYYANPELYTSEDFDMAIEYLHQAGSVLVTTGDQVTVSTETTTEVITTADNGGSSASSSGAQGTTTSASSGGTVSEPSDGDMITVTMKDGTTFKRISRQAFIKMTYEEKMAYLRTFTPEQQQAIIDDLSPDEYRSMLKQAPTNVKVDVVDNLAQAMGNMGINISINEMTNDKLTLDMRDDKGELIGVANAGVTVEDTGYDRSPVVKLAASLLAVSGALLAAVLYKLSSKKRIGE